MANSNARHTLPLPPAIQQEQGLGVQKTSTRHFTSGPNSSVPHSWHKEMAGVLGRLRSAEYADGLSRPPPANGFVRFDRGRAGGPALGFSSPQSCKVGGGGLAAIITIPTIIIIIARQTRHRRSRRREGTNLKSSSSRRRGFAFSPRVGYIRPGLSARHHGSAPGSSSAPSW